MDLLIKNATVYTLSCSERAEEAIAIEGERITDLGSTADLVRRSREATTVLDARGKTVVPGFIDSHVHFLDIGIKKGLYLDLGEVSSKQELFDELRSYVDDSKREWILGSNWDESNWAGDQSFPKKQELDEITSTRPIALQRVDCHTYCVNSEALARLDVDGSTRGAETSGNELTGVLSEDAAVRVSHEIAPTREDLSRALKIAQKEAHSKGVTGVHQMVIDDGEFRDYFHAYQNLLQKGRLNLRCRLYFTKNYLDDFLNLGIRSNFGDQRLKIGGLKIFTDGSIGSRTAWTTEEYREDPERPGISMIETKELDDLVRHAHMHGLQVAIHAIGDQALQQTIDAIERAMGMRNRTEESLRHRIEHCEMATDEQIERMANLGIIASMQPNFTGEWGLPGGMYEKRFGECSLHRLNRLRAFKDRGVRLSLGSDGMPFGPLYGIHWAVNTPFESQRLSPREAFREYTLGSSYAGSSEDRTGTLEPGKFADLALLDDDPIKNPDLIKDITVEKTIVGGEIVYKREEAEG